MKKFGEGDRVISKGDSWICADSRGVIMSLKIGGSVLVRWDHIPNSRHLPGTCLYHSIISMKLDKKALRDPNYSFKMKKKINK